MSAIFGAGDDDGRAAEAAGAGPTPAQRRRDAADDPTPAVSVVVPTYRRPELIGRCLFALAAQTLARDAFEVIVVDDERSELTRRVVETIAGECAGMAVRYLRPVGGKGPAAARNTGWHAARGAVVAFTDDDTVPDVRWLEAGLATLREQPDCAATAGRVVVPRPPGAESAPTDHEKMTRGLERGSFVTANAFVRRVALQRVQGFDESFGRAWREDSDLEYRLLDEVGPIARAERAIVLHPVRPEPFGISLRQQKNAFYEALLYRKHPARYRARPDAAVPWHYYAIVALVLAGTLLLLADVGGSAGVAFALAIALVVRFALERLAGTSHRLDHVVEMLATSALIPFVAVWWRLRGALRWRVWFL
jgi:GT2 family glycosyltransferase